MGILEILKPVWSALKSFLSPILDPILDPLKTILFGLIKLAELFIKLLGLLKYFFGLWKNILQPNKLIQQIIAGTFASINAVYIHIKNISSPTLLFSKVLPKNKNSSKGLFGHNSSSANKVKCIRPTWFRLVLMILCPPLALFMKVGLAGWYYVVLCTILTIYGYYFPGLIYATMHILC